MFPVACRHKDKLPLCYGTDSVATGWYRHRQTRKSTENPCRLATDQTDQPAGSEGRRVMIFPKPRSGITVIQKNPADGRFVFSDNAVVSWETGRLLGHDAKSG